LFIFYYEIVTKSKNILVKFILSIYNQQLLFTFAIPYTLNTNDDDTNGSMPLTVNITFEFSNWIHVKKHWNYLRLECKNWQHNGCRLNCDDDMHVSLLKTFFRLWLNAKIFHPCKHFFSKCCSCIFI
jgi:hypothetical protein